MNVAASSRDSANGSSSNRPYPTWHVVGRGYATACGLTACLTSTMPEREAKRLAPEMTDEVCYVCLSKIGALP